MKNITKKICDINMYLLLSLTLVLLIVKSKIISSTIIYSANLWFNNLVTSLFPMFFIVSIMIGYNIPKKLGKILKPLFGKLFRVDDNSIFIIVMSILTGFLGGAKYITSLYKDGIISLDTANLLLMYTHFGNPLFIINYVGISLFNNSKFGFIILFIQLITNIIIGIIFRPKKIIENIVVKKTASKVSFANIFNTALMDSFSTLLMILGSMTIFLIISELVCLLPLSYYFKVFIKAFLEVTSGVNAISLLHIRKDILLLFTNLCVCFGGLNIHLQVGSLLENTKIKYKYFLKGRIIASIISSILVLLVVNLGNML